MGGCLSLKSVKILRGLSITLCAATTVWLTPVVARHGRKILVSSVAGVQTAIDAAAHARVLAQEAAEDWAAEVIYRHRELGAQVGANLREDTRLTDRSAHGYADANQHVDAKVVNK